MVINTKFTILIVLIEFSLLFLNLSCLKVEFYNKTSTSIGLRLKNEVNESHSYHLAYYFKLSEMKIQFNFNISFKSELYLYIICLHPGTEYFIIEHSGLLLHKVTTLTSFENESFDHNECKNNMLVNCKFLEQVTITKSSKNVTFRLKKEFTQKSFLYKSRVKYQQKERIVELSEKQPFMEVMNFINLESKCEKFEFAVIGVKPNVTLGRFNIVEDNTQGIIQLFWKFPPIMELEYFTIKYSDSIDSDSFNVSKEIHQFNLFNLRCNSLYNVSVCALNTNNSRYCLDELVIKTSNLSQMTTAILNKTNITSVSSCQIQVEWQLTMNCVRGFVYMVKLLPHNKCLIYLHQNFQRFSMPNDSNINCSSNVTIWIDYWPRNTLTIKDLQPSTQYEFELYVIHSAVSPPAIFSVKTLDMKQISLLNSSDDINRIFHGEWIKENQIKVTLHFNIFNEIEQLERLSLIIKSSQLKMDIVKSKTFCEMSQNLFSKETWSSSDAGSTNIYELKFDGTFEKIKLFIIGENSSCIKENRNTECNGPLKSNTDYDIALRLYTKEGFTTTETITINRYSQIKGTSVRTIIFLSIGFFMAAILFFFTTLIIFSVIKILRRGNSAVLRHPERQKKSKTLTFSGVYEEAYSIIFRNSTLIRSDSPEMRLNSLYYEENKKIFQIEEEQIYETAGEYEEYKDLN